MGGEQESSGWRWFVEKLSKLRQEESSAAVSGWVGAAKRLPKFKP